MHPHKQFNMHDREHRHEDDRKRRDDDDRGDRDANHHHENWDAHHHGHRDEHHHKPHPHHEQAGIAISDTPGNDVLIGTQGNDTLGIGFGNDIAFGSEGDDNILSYNPYGGGDDIVFGGAGNDVIDVGRGADFVNGGPGNDTINLNAPAQTIPGWLPDGPDTVVFEYGAGKKNGFGHDSLDAVQQEDVLVFIDHSGRTNSLDDLAAQTRLVDIGIGAYRIEWMNGKQSVEIDLNDFPNEFLPEPLPEDLQRLDNFTTLDQLATAVNFRFGSETIGTEGDDLLIGTDGSDTLFGNFGDDIIFAGDGDDTVVPYFLPDGSDVIFGGRGNDSIGAGTGGDFVNGGPGNDTISVNSATVHPPPFLIPDGRDTVVFEYGRGESFGHDKLDGIQQDDVLVFIDKSGRTDNLDDLATQTRLVDIGIGAYRIEWLNGKQSVEIDLYNYLNPDINPPPPDVEALDNFTTLDELATAVNFQFFDGWSV